MQSNPSPSPSPTPSHDPETGSPVMPAARGRRNPVPPLFVQESPDPVTGPAEPLGGPPAAQPTRPASRRRGPGHLFGGGSPQPEQRGPLDLDGPPDSSGPSTSSPDKPTPVTRSIKELREGTRNAVVGASELAHERLARDDLDRINELYVADPDDAQHIGDPIAALIDRNLRRAGISTNADTADIVALVVGVAVYTSKQLSKWLAIRRLRRLQGGTPANPGQAHDPAEQVAPL